MTLGIKQLAAATALAASLAAGGAQAAQITSMTGDGTFTGGVAVNTPWTGTLTMDTNSGSTFTDMVPNAFLYLGLPVSIGALQDGLHADDNGTVNFDNLAITWGGNVFGIGDANLGQNGQPPSIAFSNVSIGGGNFDLAWTGGSGIGLTTWTFAGTYEVVPIPAAAWMFGSAVLGMIGIARRKKMAA